MMQGNTRGMVTLVLPVKRGSFHTFVWFKRAAWFECAVAARRTLEGGKFKL